MTIRFDADYFAKLGVRLDPGLSDSEIRNVEEMYGFVFPPDLRELLQFGLPVGKGFVNWRDGSRVEIIDRLKWPNEGICFDIETMAFG